MGTAMGGPVIGGAKGKVAIVRIASLNGSKFLGETRLLEDTASSLLACSWPRLRTQSPWPAILEAWLTLGSFRLTCCNILRSHWAGESCRGPRKFQTRSVERPVGRSAEWS
jgi:hypothetical protein